MRRHGRRARHAAIASACTARAHPVGNVDRVFAVAPAPPGAAPHVSTPVFEGPIDLLVHLVSCHEVDILDVPLAPVVDGFVAVLREHPGCVPLDARSQFLLMASILLEVKTQRLLPGPDDVDDDEELFGWENVTCSSRGSSSAAPTRPRPTPSWSSPSTPPARCHARSVSTRASSSTRPTFSKGSAPTGSRRPTCARRRRVLRPGWTSPT